MKKRFVFILFIFLSVSLFSQIKPIRLDKPKKQGQQFSNKLGNSSLDSISNRDEFQVELSEKTTYKDYKIINFAKDSVYVDSTLTLKKDYKFNYLRKDNFELIPFHNQGQTFNKLAYTFDTEYLYPQHGASAKYYNYYKITAINDYQVATPFTELAYRKGMKQGQFLDALITLNFSKRQNIALNYKGLRSLGLYRHSLASHKNLRFSYSYTTKNKRYHLNTHVTSQELYNDENGGLTAQSIINYESGISDFKDRGRLETNFTDAHNILRSNRYYIDHSYNLLSKKDSLSTQYNIKLGHVFTYKTKHYQFNQTAKNDYFGEAFTTKISDANHLKEIQNQVNIALESDKLLGSLKLFLENYYYSYNFRDVVIIDNHVINQSINDAIFSTGAHWKTAYKGVEIQAKAASTIKGNLNANYFKATASYKKDSLLVLKATLLNNSKSPNYNTLINQSNYNAYNWKNTGFKNELTRTLLFELELEKILNTSAQITQLDHYTYFTKVDEQIKPFQYNETINYLKIKASKAISYKRFTLDNTVMYQKVATGASVFKVPEFITRNSLYYSNAVFKKKPMYLQTGITLKYHTNYFANGYNPLLSEFYLQHDIKIGNHPIIDVFMNARVRNMRIFLKAEHINTLIDMKQVYYAAPNQPYRDFTFRFGVVWNFFI